MKHLDRRDTVFSGGELLKCAAIALALGLAGCGGLGNNERQSFEEGVQALEASKWQQAERAFSAVIKVRPKFGTAYLRRARALFELDRHEAACTDLEHAIDEGLLPRDELIEAWQLRGRALVERGRTLVDAATFRRQGAEGSVARQARDLFLEANAAFRAVLALDENHYDAHLWRGFALYRQENHLRALEEIDRCEELDSGNWRHELLAALAWEGANGPNEQSLARTLAIAARHRDRETEDVHLYLLDLVDEVPEESRAAIVERLSAFSERNPGHSPEIDGFLAQDRNRRASDHREQSARDAIAHAESLQRAEKFLEAKKSLEKWRQVNGEHPAVVEFASAIDEEHSHWLERRAELVLAGDQPEEPRRGLELLQRAVRSTRNAARKTLLRTRLESARDRLRRDKLQREIREVRALLQSGQDEEALVRLERFNTRRLAPRELDFVRYGKGKAALRLGDWKAAVDSLELVTEEGRKRLARFPVEFGTALVESGQEARGFEVLSQATHHQRDDGLDRRLAAWYERTGNTRKALAIVEALRQPGDEDRSVARRLHAQLGRELFAQDKFATAAAELQRALDPALGEDADRRAVSETTHLLARCKQRLGELEAARKLYLQLVAQHSPTESAGELHVIFEELARVELALGNHLAAHSAIGESRELGDEISEDLRDEAHRLTAAFEDYAPMDKVSSWRYSIRGPRGTTSLLVSVDLEAESDGARALRARITQRDGEIESVETWTRDGAWLRKERYGRTWSLPIAIDLESTDLPASEASHPEETSVALLAWGEQVELSNGKGYAGCLKLRCSQEVRSPQARPRSAQSIIWLAPDVGEVRREIWVQGRRIATVELDAVAWRGAEE